MKKILLVDLDSKMIGDLQAQYARRCEILATDDYSAAYKLVKTVPIFLVLIQLPDTNSIYKLQKIKFLLKKLNRKHISKMTKLLIVPKGGECHLEDFLKYNVSAVVVDVGEVGRWIINSQFCSPVVKKRIKI